MQHTSVTQMSSRGAARPRGHLGNGAFTLDKRLVRPLVLLTVEVAWRAGGWRREGKTKPPTAHRPCDPARVVKLVLLSYKVFVISDKLRMRNTHFLCGHCTQVLEEGGPALHAGL